MKTLVELFNGAGAPVQYRITFCQNFTQGHADLLFLKFITGEEVQDPKLQAIHRF